MKSKPNHSTSMRRLIFFLLFILSFFGNTTFADERQDAEKFFKEGYKYYEAKEYPKALLALQQALELSPNNAKIYGLMGMINMEEARSLDDAIAAFKKATILEPSYAEAYHNLGVIYASRFKDIDMAEEYFNKAITVSPKFERGYLALGWICLSERQKAHEASKYFEKAIEINPKLAEAQFGLGMSYVALGKNALAVRSVSALYEMNRNQMAAAIEKLMLQTQSAGLASDGVSAKEGSAKKDDGRQGLEKPTSNNFSEKLRTASEKVKTEK